MAFLRRKIGYTVLLIAGFCLLNGPLLFGKDRARSVTTISYGAYQETGGNVSISGSEFSVSFKYFLTEHWAPFAQIANGGASGDTTVNGIQYSLSSSKTTFSGGIQWHYYLDTKPEITPYVGIGLSLVSYQYNFSYPGSEIGNTSGTGYGPLFLLGARIDISKHFLIIPGYQYEQVAIKSEAGNSETIVSSGFQLALVLRF